MTDTNRFVMIGLPASGKTTFLAALWYLVQHREIEHGLTLDHYEGDSGYLNHISKLWARFELVPRTPTGVDRTVSMFLKDAVENKITLTFPDLSGESFMSQWTDRHLTASYSQFLENSVGGVLFISPLNYQKPARIVAALRVLQEAGAAEPAGGEHDDNVATHWDPVLSPTQVQLVELLQFIAQRDYFKPPFRLALVISAWDYVLASESTSPTKWLKDEMPFLLQFLESNRRLFDFNVYGVSAQGGEYNDIARLTAMKPSERILIEGDGVQNPHDLTELLTWLMR